MLIWQKSIQNNICPYRAATLTRASNPDTSGKPDTKIIYHIRLEKERTGIKIMHFFKKLPHMATPTELREIQAKLDAEMQGLTQKWALDSLGIEKYLPLLTIADNEKMGKTKAILYAYRFGYLADRKRSPACDPVKTEVYGMLNEIKNPRSLKMIRGFVRGAYTEEKRQCKR